MREVFRFVFAIAVAMAAMATSSGLMAQNFPSRPVVLVVTFPPGGGSDLLGRAIARALGEGWRYNVIVDNKPGGNTIIGTEAAARAAPDGHTMLMVGATFTVSSSLYEKLPYDIFRDFAPVAMLHMGTPVALAVHPNSPARSIKELIALAKSKPGQMNFGSSGTGGVNHLAGELLNMMAETKVTHVPYKGAAPMLTDAMAGRLDFIFNGTTGVLPHIQSGKLRALAVTSPARVAALPDVPTLDESGLKGFNVAAWNAMVVPGKTPEAIVARLNADLVRAMEAPQVQAFLKADGSVPGTSSPQQARAFIREDAEKWARVIKAANIKPD